MLPWWIQIRTRVLEISKSLPFVSTRQASWTSLRARWCWMSPQWPALWVWAPWRWRPGPRRCLEHSDTCRTSWLQTTFQRRRWSSYWGRAWSAWRRRSWGSCGISWSRPCTGSLDLSIWETQTAACWTHWTCWCCHWCSRCHCSRMRSWTLRYRGWRWSCKYFWQQRVCPGLVWTLRRRWARGQVEVGCWPDTRSGRVGGRLRGHSSSDRRGGGRGWGRPARRPVWPPPWGCRRTWWSSSWGRRWTRGPASSVSCSLSQWSCTGGRQLPSSPGTSRPPSSWSEVWSSRPVLGILPASPRMPRCPVPAPGGRSSAGGWHRSSWCSAWPWRPRPWQTSQSGRPHSLALQARRTGPAAPPAASPPPRTGPAAPCPSCRRRRGPAPPAPGSCWQSDRGSCRPPCRAGWSSRCCGCWCWDISAEFSPL